GVEKDNRTVMWGIDPRTLRFQEAIYLRLLLVPAALFIAWCWRFRQRSGDARRLHNAHIVPVAERFGSLGALWFWLCLIIGLSFIVLALAEPAAKVPVVRTAGIDLIVLQDGSASMAVRDVTPDRWGRSVRFLRVLAESLQWTDDRVALALFAHVPAAQVRLTN